MNEKIYVTGHRHPDTDSVAGAIAYAYLRERMGDTCVPCCLGSLNEETKYLLKRFDFPLPYVLKDARLALNDIALDDPVSVSPDTSIQVALEMMKEASLSYMGVVDEDNHLLGIVTVSDISRIAMGDTSVGIDLLKDTSIMKICDAVGGKLIYADTERKLNGKVSIIAISADGVDHYEIKDRVVILGDDPEAQKTLIRKGAGALIVVWTQGIKEDVIALAEEYHCSLIISGHGSMNTSRYIYFAPPVEMILRKDVVKFSSDELLEDVSRKMAATRHRTYPVLDENQRLLGYVSRYHMMSAPKRKIVLVDHNEFSQSVKSIEKAEIIEVVDHHRISDFSTPLPINFRNETVGSTATILTGMFQERQIWIPKNLAALLLGAILSDTLNFSSPTTTQRDIFMANVLSQISGLDIPSFSRELFGIYRNALERSMKDVITTDMKVYDFNGHTTYVSQVLVYDFSGLKDREEEIRTASADIIASLEGATIVVAFTSIIDKATYFTAEGRMKKIIENHFSPDREHKGIVSRKLQIIPVLQEIMTI